MCLRHSLGLRLVFRKHLLYDALAEDIRGDSLVARCLVSVERALYIYPIGEVTRLPFEWYCRCQKARLVHHTCKSATRALNDFRATELVGCYRPLIVGCSCRQASLATGVSKDGRHLQGELQYGMLPSPQDWPELYSWWDESTSRAHEWDGECIPSTGTGAGLELAWWSYAAPLLCALPSPT